MSYLDSIPAEWRVVHPVLKLPTEAAYLRALAGGPVAQARFEESLRARAEVIALEREDPAGHGYEPPLWRILDAMCGLPWIDHPEEVIQAAPEAQRVAMRADKAWCLKVRRKLLKRDAPVKVLLLQGGNRAGKSEWAASRVQRLLRFKHNQRAWCFHQNERMSIDYQQSLMEKYLPAELRGGKAIRSRTTYLSYQKQNGFPNKKFTLPNGSDCVFNTYEQDKKTIEGGELDVIWCDELVPRSWVQELKARIATRMGWLFITFTPKEGYSPTVKMFLDVARPTVESIAFVLPEDGGEARLDLALAGEDPLAWLEPEAEPDPDLEQKGTKGTETEGENVEIRKSGTEPDPDFEQKGTKGTKGQSRIGAQPEVPAGRRFTRVKRVLTVDDNRSAVVYFHCFDNPYGNPAELYALYGNNATEAKKMVFYGVAEKAVSGMFPKFNQAVHVVQPENIPALGTNYQVCDPSSGRNWVLGWARVVNAPAGRTIYFYREWPCPGKYVPGVGDMGNWAEPGEKHDGDRGTAQVSLGWGLRRYVQEHARLEGRTDWERARGPEEEDFRWDEDDEPEARQLPQRQRSQESGVRSQEGIPETIYQRIMDSRAAAMPTQTREGSTTLLEQMGDTELNPAYEPAAGGAFAEDSKVHWVQLINDLLDSDDARPLDALNQPRLFVSAECKNLIFALQNWTGEDGLKGACRDFVNLVQYLVLAEPEDFSGTKGRGVFNTEGTEGTERQ